MYDQFSQFDPSHLVGAATAILYYLFLAGTLFFGISTVYTLIKYARSRSMGFVVSIIYLIIYFELINQGLIILNTLK